MTQWKTGQLELHTGSLFPVGAAFKLQTDVHMPSFRVTTVQLQPGEKKKEQREGILGEKQNK